MPSDSSDSSHLGRWLLLLIVVVAVGLRAWNFPARYEIRDVDELPYLQGSLALLEGITPSLKYAPAGPQTWLGWAYAGTITVEHLVRPGPDERRVPMEVRPFAAVDHALFDLHRDYSGLKNFELYIAFALSILATIAAFKLGQQLGGLPGALLLGGLLAGAPMFVRYTNMPRPFSMGWSFAMLALYYAWASQSKRRWTLSIILMGLAIGSRIDLLLLLPIWWSALWAARKGSLSQYAGEISDLKLQIAEPPPLPFPGVPMEGGIPAPGIIRATFAAAIVTLLVAPWLLTNLIGNLRTIFTVRLATPAGGPVPIGRTIRGLTWHEGFGVLLPLFIVAIVLWPGRWLLKGFAILVALSMLKATAMGFQHQAAPILVMIFFSAAAVGALYSRWPCVAWGLVIAALLLPLGRTIGTVIHEKKAYVPDESVEWVTAQVPAGTIVYTPPGMHNLLPTPQASAALWAEVTDDAAWRKKFGTGLTRFGLSTDELPRALSEEHMLHEKGFRRGWYITGGRSWLPDPRFDVRLYHASAVFGLQDPVPEFKRTGGVLVWKGPAIPELGEPAVKWVNENGRGTYVYVREVMIKP